VSGGGGAKPRPIQRGAEDLYQDSAFPNYNYVKIVEHRGSMEATMIRVADPNASAPSWQEKDHFEIPAATELPQPQRTTKSTLGASSLSRQVVHGLG
jgi:hypothetical protein